MDTSCSVRHMYYLLPVPLNTPHTLYVYTSMHSCIPNSQTIHWALVPKEKVKNASQIEYFCNSRRIAMAAGAHASPESLVQSFRWAEKTLEWCEGSKFQSGKVPGSDHVWATFLL